MLLQVLLCSAINLALQMCAMHISQACPTETQFYFLHASNSSNKKIYPEH